MDKVIKNLQRLPAAAISATISLIIVSIIVFVLWSVVDSVIDLSGLWRQVTGYVNEVLPTSSVTFWIVTIIALLFGAAMAKKPWKYGFYLVIVAVAAIWLSPFLERTFTSIDRGINQGDWSEPAGYVRTVSNGTVRMRRGVVENFYVVGKVTLINNNDHSCLKISPEGKFRIESSADFRRNIISALSEEKEMVFVEVKSVADCP